MRNVTIVVVISVFFSTSAFAGTMRGWVESAYLKMNTPLLNTLETYRSDGFILIDVANNYAAYSYKAKRLSKKQRTNVTSVEADANLVIQYNSCSGQTSFLGGKISAASVKYKVEKAEDLAEELRELVEWSESKNLKPWGFGASKQRDDQVYLGWGDDGRSIEIQINKNTHQLVWQINKPCPN